MSVPYALLGLLEQEPRHGCRYAITDEGTAELDRWLADPLEPEPHLQAALFTKVVVAILSGRPVEPLVDAERHAHLERMRELTAVRRSASLPVALLADYALFHLEADLRWLDLTAARVDDLRTQILDRSETP
jgi:DNA-binding PadR family transcriptional regulator